MASWGKEAVANSHRSYKDWQGMAVANSEAWLGQFNPKAMANIDNYRWNSLKKYDIISNELGEVFEELGVDYYDDPNSVILSLLGHSIQMMAPDTYQYMAGWKQGVQSVIHGALYGATPMLHFLQDTLGLGLMEKKEYATANWDTAIPGLEGMNKAHELVQKSENPEEMKQVLNKYHDLGIDMGDFEKFKKGDEEEPSYM